LYQNVSDIANPWHPLLMKYDRSVALVKQNHFNNH